ncbi:uncharacterized protein LOC120282650 [Dioscorea cayenensis subsp. rotundata]|uniref:Uncharacterized protein LOC120282650 n=1 Tax=Dioscorea cayennensis subsp. rotundata TaxID=55577 RepID=A0AB40CZR5_DIOCR|nr:uncharacterized protein LOC120282650 [Dioscorea cayenensis subsp. rotundata]
MYDRYAGGDPQVLQLWRRGHLSKACPKPPKERETGRREQSGGRGRGRRGHKGGIGGGYQAHQMIDPQVEEKSVLTEEENELFEMLKRKQGMIGHGGKKSMTDEISTSDSKDSGASRHVIGVSSEITSFTHLTPPESIQTADGTSQPMVGKGELYREGDKSETWDWHVA